ncbi:MAG: nucleoside deaminase [Alphaproteobacteria bacterium]|jgi:tRNA(Arg) A34 adenosine deaminase TadA|nr:MAG: nucleoside deaminase [Alphaproteobacteria bacterium]
MPSAVSEIRLPDWLAGLALPAAPVADETCMRLAIAAASKNVALGSGGPFGAVIRNDSSGEIIAVGVNLAMTSGNPVLHAETVAISLAGRRLAETGGVTLFTSCEPCIMCLGASHWAEIGRIVSAALKEDAEAVGFSEGAGTEQLRVEMEARGVVFQPGLLRDEGAAVLREYAARGGEIYGPES